MAETPPAPRVRPVTHWRCMVPDCRIEGRWQPILAGEEHYPSHDRRSHYWTEHYEPSEREFARQRAEAKQRRVEHYRLTGEFLRE